MKERIGKNIKSSLKIGEKYSKLFSRFKIYMALTLREKSHFFRGNKNIIKNENNIEERIRDTRKRLTEVFERQESQGKHRISPQAGRKENEYGMTDKISDEDPKLKSISEIEKESKYKREYLAYLIRQKKIKAKKVGGQWKTTSEWMREFEDAAAIRKKMMRKALSEKLGGGKNRNDQKSGENNFGALFGIKGRRSRKFAVAAIILLMLFIANASRAEFGMWEDIALQKIFTSYNFVIEKIAYSLQSKNKDLADSIRRIEIEKNKIDELAKNIEDKKEVFEFEKENKISVNGTEQQKASLAYAEKNTNGVVAGDQMSNEQMKGRILAAESSSNLKPNATDIEVSAYLMNQENQEVTNGEYDVRFSLYSKDRTERDPYPSDEDKGARVWEETQKVNVHNGLLLTYLGEITPIPDDIDFSSKIFYLGIRVGNDSEMIPRKRIAAVPISKVAISLQGYTPGNEDGKIPISNGTLNINLNADKLDGLHASDFLLAADYPAPNEVSVYSSWSLQDSSGDTGQNIESKDAAIFKGGNGIGTSRSLNTLTISPIYGSDANTVAEGDTPITINTTGNLQGGGTGTVGGGVNFTLDTVLSPTFEGLYLNSSTPFSTTDALYNNSGTLMWNGSAVGGGGSLPPGTNGQTLYSSSGIWTATSNLFNDGTSVGIGTATPANTLDIGNSGGIHITSGIPSSTGMALYNNSGTLMWNGSAVGGGGSLPPGTNGQTLYSSSGIWTATSNLFNDGTSVGIGTATPANTLDIGNSGGIHITSGIRLPPAWLSTTIQARLCGTARRSAEAVPFLRERMVRHSTVLPEYGPQPQIFLMTEQASA